MDCDPNKEQLPLSISGKGNQTVVLICNVGTDCNSKSNISVIPTKPVPIVKEGNSTENTKQKNVMVKLQKEIDKQKKLLAKAEAKQKKEADKLAKEEQRKQKLEERLKLREKEQQEKKERKEKREAERKRKLDEQAEKTEAKRRKEMEREEKERLEREKKQRLSDKFVGFFDRQSKVKSLMSTASSSSLPRQPLNNEMSDKLDLEMKNQSYSSDYLAQCKHKSIRSGCHYDDNDVQIVSHDKPRFKLLQFSENHRPPYWGSWRKKSKIIKARTPFSKDEEALDYDIDSDDEWEEEEPGESLSDSETESVGNNDEQEEDEDNDGFFVPHGYLSEDEGNDSDGELTDDNRQRKQLAKVKAWEAEFNKKHDRLVPIYVGIVRPSNQLKDSQTDLLRKYSLVQLTSTSAPIATTAATSINDGNGKQDHQSNTRQPVPESAMPDLIQHVHKSNMGLKRLVDTFRDYWGHKNSQGDPDDTTKPSPNDSTPQSHPSCISKRQLELKITSIANKGSNKVWLVHGETLRQYGFNMDTDVTPLIIRSESPSDIIKRKTTPSQAPVGMKSIKHFFTSPSDNTLNVARRSLSLQTPPPQKKRRISLEPVIILDEENVVPCREKNPEVITPTDAAAPLIQGGIDWEKQLQERNKLTVPADIHI